MPLKTLKWNHSVSKWQIALAIGTPVVVGIGVWYYYYRQHGSVGSCGGIDKLQALMGCYGRSDTKSGSIDSVDVGSDGRTLDGETSVKSSEELPKDESGGSLEDKADAAKVKGNRFFKEGKYDEAIKCYTEAIALCPPELCQNISTFYQNRAAAHEKLKNYPEVISDSNRALDLNPKYTKALNRRAKAYEHTNELHKALLDATAICILEEFQNQSSLILADRVLKELGKQRAAKEIKNHKPIFPSKHFIRTYFSSFAEDPIFKPDIINGVRDADNLHCSGFLKAQHDLISEEYDNIVEDCTAQLLAEDGSYSAESLLLRATFAILRGQSDAAFSDLKTLLANTDLSTKIRVNALIKQASLRVQHELVDKAFGDFKIAEEVDSNNADIFHHRGQVNLLLERMDDSVADFERATSLNPKFVIAAVQRCYADYRYAVLKHDYEALQRSMDAFVRTIQSFPRCAEGYTLYAQALVDQQEFDKAEKYYDKALKEDPDNANIYVHKGLLHLHIKQDYAEAVRLIEKAIEKDDRCEFAYETLGALEVQRGDLDHSLELFDRAVALARTEVELSHLYSLRDAAEAQKIVAKRLGIPIPRFDNV